MQRVHRQVGKILPRTADEAQVGLLIKDFDHASDLLGLLIKSTKAWQQAWQDTLDTQERLVTSFISTAQPIPGASEDSYNGPQAQETPAHITKRLAHLRHEYRILREELEPDLRAVDAQIVSPAHQAKDSMVQMKKTIKTRENCKLDFERYQSRRDGAFSKPNRSEKDNIALAKHESDLEIARDTYERADRALRSTLPGLLDAVYALLPGFLATLVRTAHQILANYYTTIHEFCAAEHFPAPPPPMADVIMQWAESCKPAQSQVESLHSCASTRKGRLGGFGAAAPRVVSNGASNGTSSRISPSPSDSLSNYSQDRVRRVPSGNLSQATTYGQDHMRRAPSQNFQPAATALRPPPSPGVTAFRPPPSPGAAEFLTPSIAATKPDYFSRDRVPSTASVASSVASIAAGNSAASIAAGKKKPPPPPPKRIGSRPQEIWVTALYDFGGQNQGDLQMKEGDKIKVLKKTDSTNDWWEGECNGMRGAFPANYCKV